MQADTPEHGTRMSRVGLALPRQGAFSGKTGRGMRPRPQILSEEKDLASIRNGPNDGVRPCGEPIVLPSLPVSFWPSFSLALCELVSVSWQVFFLELSWLPFSSRALRLVSFQQVWSRRLLHRAAAQEHRAWRVGIPARSCRAFQLLLLPLLARNLLPASRRKRRCQCHRIRPFRRHVRRGCP